jgi:hypothetical protein
MEAVGAGPRRQTPAAPEVRIARPAPRALGGTAFDAGIRRVKLAGEPAFFTASVGSLVPVAPRSHASDWLISLKNRSNICNAGSGTQLECDGERPAAAGDVHITNRFETGGRTMNWEQVQGNWKQFKGKPSRSGVTLPTMSWISSKGSARSL